MSTPNTGRPHIQHAYCQCPIGLAQACSHIGALLFALSHAKPSKSSSESWTSQPCKWIIPGRQVKPTGPITSLPNKYNEVDGFSFMNMKESDIFLMIPGKVGPLLIK